MKKRISLGLPFVCLLLLFSIHFSFSDIQAENDFFRDYWPTDEWQTATPKSKNMDSNKLEEMLEFIDEENPYYDSIVLVRHGYIILERYYFSYGPDDIHHLWSSTKSFISALAGIALEEGLIGSLNDKMLDYFPNKTITNYEPRRENITIEHLLTMSSGIAWDFYLHQAIFNGHEDPVEFALNLPLDFDPGSQFEYINGGPHVLSGIIHEVINSTVEEFAIEKLFNPIGIKDFLWPKDQQNVTQGSYGLSLTPRDCARFGYLYLNNGTWDDQQIIPTDWVIKSIEEYWTLTSNVSYGYLWWVYPYNNCYATRGYEEQNIFVLPEYDIVFVTTGKVPSDTVDARYLIDDYIIPAVMQNTKKMSHKFIISLIAVIPFLTIFYSKLSKRKILND